MKLAIQRTLADVRAAGATTIYCAVHTCWWSDQPPPYRIPTDHGHGLPCDPRGSVLMQTGDMEGFLASAERNPAHYGRHGLRALEAALHGNVTTDDGRPTSFESWDRYNELLDASPANQGVA